MKVCIKINIDFKLIIVVLEHLWKYYIPSGNDISNFPSLNAIRMTFSGLFGDEHVCLKL